MSLEGNDDENSIKIFDDWGDVDRSLQNEINASLEKRTEISLFNGKIISKTKESIFYSFRQNNNDFIDVNNILEIKYKDKAIPETYVSKVKNNQVVIQIPRSAVGIPEVIPILILVNDPSFILQQLKEALVNIKEDVTSPKSFVDTIFGSKKEIGLTYAENSSFNNSAFDYNDQQLNAITRSIQNKVLFIWGPPGTGKTTVLGKIISEHVKRNETVLLCSNTNRALDVSILKALEVSDFETTPIKERSLRWGNVFLKEEEDLKYVTLESHIERRKAEKEELIKKEVDLLALHQELSKKLNDLKVTMRPYMFAKRSYDRLMKKDSLNDHQQSEKERLKSKLKDLQPRDGSLEQNIENSKKDLLEIENRIQEEYGSVNELREFVIKNTLVSSVEVLNDIRFQAATFAKTVVDENLREQKFDNILIDEASMANLPYLLYLCTLAKKRIVFVGDPQQLSPIFLSSGKLAEKWLKNDIFLKVASVSNVESLFQWQKDNSNISVLLTDQYRMPEKIFNIVNDLFYKGILINKASTNGSIKVIDTSNINPPISFPSNNSKSPLNTTHSELLIANILETLSSMQDKKHASQSIGVIVPFTQQKRFIQYLTQVRYLPDSLEVGVVHTFQGREKPKIYFDLTLSNIDFTYPNFDESKTSLTDVSRLLNVAISRCQSSSSGYFDGEFVLLANVDHFKTFYPDGIVLKFINAILDNADEIIEIAEPINPLKLSEQEDGQMDIFNEPEEEEIISINEKEELKDEEKIDDFVSSSNNQRIQKEIEKNCTKITREIQKINYCGEQIDGKEIFVYTSTIDDVLAELPVTYCENKNSFKIFIDMMYKLIYESPGGNEAPYPVRDSQAKFGKDTYGKIRLQVHQLRQYYFHDYKNWEENSQKKLLGHVNEFFNNTIAKPDPDEDHEWVNCQLAILFRTSEYLSEIGSRYKKKLPN